MLIKIIIILIIIIIIIITKIIILRFDRLLNTFSAQPQSVKPTPSITSGRQEKER